MKRLCLTALLVTAVACTSVALARQSDKRAKTPTTDSATSAPASDADVIKSQLMHYPIDTCIVGGGKLDSKGAPVDYVHEGRLVRFCCKGCVGPFKKDSKTYLAKLDKAIVAEQLEAYPLDTCVVSGNELGPKEDAFAYIYENRLVLLCCGGCARRAGKDLPKLIGKLDAAYADAQRSSYPLTTCVVAGGELGSMGDPHEIVAGTTLVRFCCKGCVPRFQKDPGKYLAKLQD